MIRVCLLYAELVHARRQDCQQPIIWRAGRPTPSVASLLLLLKCVIFLPYSKRHVFSNRKVTSLEQLSKNYTENTLTQESVLLALMSARKINWTNPLGPNNIFDMPE